MRKLLLTAMLLTLSSNAAAQTPAPAVSAYEDAISSAKANMMADPSIAYDSARQAEALVQNAAEGGRLQVATAQWLQGEALNRMNRTQDAEPVIEAALQTARVLDPKSKLYGDLLVARGGIAGANGDYANAVSSFQSAYEVFRDNGEKRAQSMALLNLGGIYSDARNFERALYYLKLAGEAFDEDPSIELARLNNVAIVYRDMADLSNATSAFRQSLDIAKHIDSPMLVARILTNIASAELDQGDITGAEQTLKQALDLSRSAPTGWESFIFAMQAKTAYARDQIGRAESLMSRAFQNIDLTQTVTPYREFHEAAFDIYSAAGEFELAAKHLQAFKRLDDEARDVSAGANTALMGAQFDFANQESKIATLRSETLEKEVALQHERERQRTLMFGGAGLFGLLLLMGGTIHYLSMRRSRNDVRMANGLLSKSNKDLEKALKAKSEFLATTSHEIRTPLNGILGMTQILRQQKGLPPEIRERVDLIHVSGETMKVIVDDILDVAKMETGVVQVEAEVFDLQSTLQAVASVWRDSAHEKNVALDVDLSGCPRLLVSDERRVRQIVFNLLSNAVKFTDSGTISVKASRHFAADAPLLSIEVRDTGCGIPAEHLQAVFEAFHQVDGGKTRQHGGTGLGLSICRNLATALGGDITLTSAPNEGSVFALLLPLAEPGQASGGASSIEADDCARNVTALVDANPLRQSILCAMLEDAGYNLVTADTSADAIACLEGVEATNVIVYSSALSADCGQAMQEVMAFSDHPNSPRVIAVLEPDATVTAAMLRLSGADEVLSAPKSEARIVAILNSNEQKVSAA